MDEPGQALSDRFRSLREATPARILLGRAGQGLLTAPMLAFQLAHARARDAVHASLDFERVREQIGLAAVLVESAASGRESYLRYPQLGRRLGSSTILPRGDYDLALVLADGLSATAAHAHGPALIQAISTLMSDWSMAPVVVARQARVAIGDPIGHALGARIVVVIIGERPGLSAADSLSAYITYDPKPGRRDSQRNCVSNIREPGGLTPETAAQKISWLLRQASELGQTGVKLKDRHLHAGVNANPAPPLVCAP